MWQRFLYSSQRFKTAWFFKTWFSINIKRYSGTSSVPPISITDHSFLKGIPIKRILHQGPVWNGRNPRNKGK